MYALIATPEGPRYGYIVSRHYSLEAALRAKCRRANDIAAQCPSALVSAMHCVSELPTPAGGTGKVGERVAIDLSL